MQLTYGIKDRPKFGKNLVFAFQQMIAIMAATLLVPILVSSVGLKCDPAAALFGAGAGSIVYLLFTRFKSPVFLGSSFTFLGALQAAASELRLLGAYNRRNLCGPRVRYNRARY